MSVQATLKALAIKDAKNGNWEDAISHNLQILELDDDNTNAMNRLGVAYTQVADIKKAKQIFSQVLEIDKNNKIAKKHLDKLNNNQSCIVPSFSRGHFLEEPGKTKTVPLFRLAGKNVLEEISVGKECSLKIKSRYISVEVDSTYVGALPEDISFRLTKLMKAGNKYMCLIRSCNTKECEVFLKETYQSAENRGTHSFPPSKMALNPTTELEETEVLKENIPVEIIDTDTDTEKTLDSVDTSDLE